MTTPRDPHTDVIDRLVKLSAVVQQLVESRLDKAWYTTAELADKLGKAEFTVREWARLGRIRAEKRQSGRGPHAAWVVSHEEFLRYQREGLIPLAAVGVTGRRP